MSGITEIRSVIMQGDIARKPYETGASHHDTQQAVVAQQHVRMLERQQVTVQISDEAQRLRSQKKKDQEKKERRKPAEGKAEPEEVGEHSIEDMPERLDIRV